MNVKITNTVIICDDVSGPEFEAGTKSQILQFCLPNFHYFATNIVSKLLLKKKKIYTDFLQRATNALGWAKD